MRKPYSDSDDGYKGYNSISDEELDAYMRKAKSEKMQVLAHCCGDAATDQFIKSCLRTDNQELKHVIVHAQFIGPDQVVFAKAAKIQASFFPNHIWLWGDLYLRKFGEGRGSCVSPVNLAISNDIPYTLHNDTPITSPNPLTAVWCAVNRLTKSGIRLCVEQKCSVYEALKGITINVAKQYGEEKDKGTLEVGKLADMVVLDANPLTVDPLDIRNIRVNATVKNGRPLYKRTRTGIEYYRLDDDGEWHSHKKGLREHLIVQNGDW